MLAIKKNSKIKIYIGLLIVAAVVCLFVLYENKIIFSPVVSSGMADDENLIKINYFNKKAAGIRKIDTCIFSATCKTNEKFKTLEEYKFSLPDIKDYKIGNSNPFKKQ
ncbi:MAG: hypothetical protein ABH881_04080 [bacterium]